jgi:hypothetical protein
MKLNVRSHAATVALVNVPLAPVPHAHAMAVKPVAFRMKRRRSLRKRRLRLLTQFAAPSMSIALWRRVMAHN